MSPCSRAISNTRGEEFGYALKARKRSTRSMSGVPNAAGKDDIYMPSFCLMAASSRSSDSMRRSLASFMAACDCIIA